MTGIAGKISGELDNSLVKEMMTKLRYTHKERTDYWSDDFLSIGKVSHKIHENISQHVFNEDKSMLIVMDGEIFDYLDDKKNLLKKGHKFKSESCIEYCLHLFEEEGASGLKKLNGSFLIVIYNLKTKEVFIITDRLGSRPLFYHDKESGGLLFSSQFSSILQDPHVPRKLNKDAIFEFFTFRKILRNETFYKDIKLLGPASVLYYKNKKISISKYWKMVYGHKCYSEKKYINELSRRIKKAVERRVVENYKYGLLLSGGLDSRMVLAASPKKMTCFTFADFDNNEVRVARSIAKIKKTEHFFLKRTPDHYADSLEKAVDIGDGRYRFDHAHGIGLFQKISRECDVLFHGAMLDILFRNVNFPTNYKSLENTSLSEDIDLIFRDSLLQEKPEKLFNKNYSLGFKKRLNKSVEKSLKNIKKNNAKKFNRVLDHFSFSSAYGQRSYLHVLHNQAYIDERSIALDNDLINLYLEIPLKFRENSELFSKAITMINPDMCKVPDNNMSFVANLNPSIKRFVRSAQWFLNRISFLPNWPFLNPSYSQQSWPNSKELIRYNRKLKKLISDTIKDSNALYPEIFDINAINRMFNDHLDNKKNSSDFLFLLLTFGIWCKKYGPKQGGRIKSLISNKE